MTKEEVINKILQDWATEFLAELRSSATKLPRDTGSGERSIDVSIIKAQANTAAAAMVGFKGYMRYFDLSNRQLRRDRDLAPDSLKEIKSWVERNLDKLLPGYKGPTDYVHKPGNVPTKTIINNIAWGISKKRKRIKRKQWYAKTKANAQYRLYYQLVDGLMPVFMEQLKKQYQ